MPEDIFNSIMQFFNQYYAIILVIFGALFLFVWWLSKQGEKTQQYKAVILEKEINKYLNNVFNLTKEAIGYGKTLYIGSRDAGFVLKSIFINQYPTWKETKDKNTTVKNRKEIMLKYPETRQIFDNYDQDENNKPINILSGFETCKRGRINRFLANLFGYGIDIYLIDQKLVEINESSININAYSKPVMMFGVWIFSDWGKEELEEIAFKLHHEQMLEQFVNVIPKSIFLGDLQAGKEKATYDMLEEVNKEHKKEQLEQIKKA